MITENVSTLKINKLTNEQYNRELDAGNIDENALYLTPDDTYSKAEVNSLLPTYGAGYVSTNNNGNNPEVFYFNVSNSQFYDLQKDTKERIVFVILDSNIGTGGTVGGTTYINFCHEDNLIQHKNVMQIFDGNSWVDYNIQEGIAAKKGQCMILAVKGNGASMSPKFEYVRWLNP